MQPITAMPKKKWKLNYWLYFNYVSHFSLGLHSIQLRIQYPLIVSVTILILLPQAFVALNFPSYLFPSP